MPDLFGRAYSRRDLAAHAGALSAFAGVRLLTLGDGVRRMIDEVNDDSDRLRSIMGEAFKG